MSMAGERESGVVARGPDRTSLTGRTLTGALWSLGGRFSIQAVQFIGTVVLSRFRAPREEGLGASVTVFVAFAALLTDFGIGPCVVHLKSPTAADLATAFWINAVSGTFLRLLLIALSPLIAEAMHQPALRGLLSLGSLNFTLSVSAVHIALLERRLMFARLLVLECSAAVVGLAASIALAVAGVGASSLVWGSIATTVVTSIGAFVAVPWRPSRTFTRSAWRRLWAFSGGLFGFNVVNYWGRNGDNLVVGRALGAMALGLYSRAYGLMLFPVFTVSTALGRVLFPALAQLTAEPERIRAAYLRALRGSTAVGFPMSIGLACLAPSLVIVAYGERWAAAGPLLVALSLAGPPQIVNGTVGALLKAQGATGLLFRLGAVGAVACLAAVAVGAVFGVLGAAVAFAIYAWSNLAFVAWAGRRRVGIRMTDILRAVGPVSGAVVVMAAVVIGVGRVVVPAGRGMALTAQFGCGVVVYLIAFRVMAPATWRDLASVRPGGAGQAAGSGK